MMRRAMAITCTVVIAACSGLTPQRGFVPSTLSPAVHVAIAHPVCPPVKPGEMRCFAWMRTDLSSQLRADVTNGIPYYAGYTPKDLQSAYHLDPSKGSNQTVAIVDAFGDDSAESDLAVYRKAAGLPPCTVAGGCLRIVNQNGETSPLPAQPRLTSQNIGWVYEQTLDLDALSAVCPKCKIILLQSFNQNSSGLYAAVASAARLGANVITNSYGGTEAAPADPVQFDQPGRVIVASAGDSGGGTEYSGGPQMPCTYARVVCVGGTHLSRAGGVWKESVWNDLASALCGGCGATGSGCSTVVPKPSWQHDGGCTRRSETDVAADASPLTPFAIYSKVLAQEYGSGWQPFGGTSLSAPIVAGIFALAGNASSRHGAKEIWERHGALRDVTTGTNIYVPVTGPCASRVIYICVARAGYDGPTGWGSPSGSGAF